jgi:hypothetical protein
VTVSKAGGCFRNPVLLSSEGNHKVVVRSRMCRTNEDANGFYEMQEHRMGCEDIAERQAFLGQACLHCRSPDFTAKLQRTVRSEEFVMASQQLQMVLKSLRAASVTKAAAT